MLMDMHMGVSRSTVIVIELEMTQNARKKPAAKIAAGRIAF